jgi:hypothetical protein
MVIMLPHLQPRQGKEPAVLISTSKFVMALQRSLLIRELPKKGYRNGQAMLCIAFSLVIGSPKLNEGRVASDASKLMIGLLYTRELTKTLLLLLNLARPLVPLRLRNLLKRRWSVKKIH